MRKNNIFKVVDLIGYYNFDVSPSEINGSKILILKTISNEKLSTLKFEISLNPTICYINMNYVFAKIFMNFSCEPMSFYVGCSHKPAMTCVCFYL